MSPLKSLCGNRGYPTRRAKSFFKSLTELLLFTMHPNSSSSSWATVATNSVVISIAQALKETAFHGISQNSLGIFLCLSLFFSLSLSLSLPPSLPPSLPLSASLSLPPPSLSFLAYLLPVDDETLAANSLPQPHSYHTFILAKETTGAA